MTISLVSFISPTELTYVFLDRSTSLFVRALSPGLWCPIASLFLCCCALCRVALLAGFMRELECKSGEPTLMNLNTLCVSEVCCIHHVVPNTTPSCVIGSILQKALFDLWVHVPSPHHGVGLWVEVADTWSHMEVGGLMNVHLLSRVMLYINDRDLYSPPLAIWKRARKTFLTKCMFLMAKPGSGQC